MQNLLPALRLAARRLARAPSFALVATVTLAVGIGATTAIFSVVNTILLRPLPYPAADRLVSVMATAEGIGADRVPMSPASYATYRADNTTFEEVGAWQADEVAVAGDGEPERVAAMLVTDGVLPLLGGRPAVGRLFTREDDAPGAPPTVVLARGFWERRFGADPNAVGRTLRLDGEEHEIIGVLAQDLRPFGRDPLLFTPARFDPVRTGVSEFSFPGVGRLKPGVTPAAAVADLERLTPVMVERYPGMVTLDQIREARYQPVVQPLRDAVVGDIGGVLWVLLGTVGLVLLVACANVANLFLVQAEGRHREYAVRAALGAGRRQLISGFLAESLVLSLAAGVLGALLAWGGLRLLVAIAPSTLPRIHEICLDAMALGFTLVVSVVTAAVFGLVPVLRMRGHDVQASLRQGGRGASAGPERLGTRNVLVAIQVATALVLLVGSGLMARSFVALTRVDPGFSRPEEVLTFRLILPTAEVKDPLDVAAQYTDLLSRLAAIPGVTSAGASSSITMDRWDNNDPVEVEGVDLAPGQLPPLRRWKFIAPGYFETMGNPLVAGRALSWDDVNARARVVLVTADWARTQWGGPEQAIGKRVRAVLSGSDWYEVIGVVGAERDDGITQGPTPTIYWPMIVERLYREPVVVRRSMAFAVRSARPPASLVAEVRAVVRSLNPRVPLAMVRTLEEILRGSMARTSFALVMLGLAAGVALVLGLVGVYGVISWVVAQRTREIGVRMALGAEPWAVKRMVVRQAAGVTLAGVVLGLAASAGLTRLMGSMLHGVSPVDPPTYAAVAAALAAVALAASYVPARRAARVDPVEAMRSD